ncbi:MAG TPA: hypothetical protein VKA30_01515 [Actinomycetota bacterium]|nr:hypothetical protein [Actinomycetota bacterium]
MSRIAKVLPLWIVPVLATLPFVASNSPASAAAPCHFPGYSTWVNRAAPVHSAVWLEDVYEVNTHVTPPRQRLLFETLRSNATITSRAGNVIRADLYACNSEEGDRSSYSAVFMFRDTGDQPQWNSQDAVGFSASTTPRTVGTAVEIGRFFQQVGYTPGDNEYTITPVLNHHEDEVAIGPALRVRYTSGRDPVTDVRGPANDGDCRSLKRGEVQAQIAQGGNTKRGVYETFKHSRIQSLSYEPSTASITVHLDPADHSPSHPFAVGEPATIEHATPPGYNGRWRVGHVVDPNTYILAGPVHQNLPPGGGGLMTRYFQSGAEIPQGTKLAGWTEVCVGTAGEYFAAAKLEPTPGMRTLRWESESKIQGGVPANTRIRVKWYQTMPCNETGFLRMVPRILRRPGDFPDQRILAQGAPFLFHVVASTSQNPCAPSQSAMVGRRAAFPVHASRGGRTFATHRSALF